jgi:hypothetical protein
MNQPEQIVRTLDRHLTRPATEDLILTKMMRVDPQDRADIRFLMEQSPLDANDLESLASSARVPDLPEIREAFDQNLKWLRENLPGQCR